MNNTQDSHHELTSADIFRTMTGGRPFVFVVMSYDDPKEEIFQAIKKVVEGKYRLACIRADKMHAAGHDLLAKIHLLIERAELIIAEITPSAGCQHYPEGQHSPNVFYEIGYAVAKDKRPILVMESGKDLPTDLKGWEVLRYENRFKGQDEFSENLSNYLGSRLFSDIPVLRDMLEGPDSSASFIVTQPKRPKNTRELDEAKKTKAKMLADTTKKKTVIGTFGDRLGILGLLRAFGSILDDSAKVELVSPRHSAKTLFKQDANLYFIGSQRACEPVGKVLKSVQTDHWPRWSLDPDPDWQKKGGKKGEAPLVLIKRDQSGTAAPLKAKHEESREIWTEDYGLIVRAPHPQSKNRIVFVMAGLHSLGTGAACLAATRPQLIKEIRATLSNRFERGGILENKNHALWVVVKGNVQSSNNYLLDEKGVTIVDAGIYE